MIVRAPRAAAAWFKEKDPNTAVSEYMIRQMVSSGEIPCIRNGAKILVDCEALQKYLETKLSS